MELTPWSRVLLEKIKWHRKSNSGILRNPEIPPLVPALSQMNPLNVAISLASVASDKPFKLGGTLVVVSELVKRHR
jgi:hypothetical protein